MLSYRTQLKLAHFIKALAEAEKHSEIVRQVIAEQLLFEPYTAFRRLDTDRNSFITTKEISDFLYDNSIYANTAELQHLFNVFDANDDGLITYDEYFFFYEKKSFEKTKVFFFTIRQN